MNNLNFTELDSNELMEIDGGGVNPVIIVGAIVVVGAFAVGVYNGYKDTRK